MSYPIYYVEEGDTLPHLFASYDGGTGASITLTGLAVTDIEIYKDGGATQRASDAGYTLLDTDGIDFDGITGIHGFSINLNDNTDAGFYSVGPWYHVVVSAVTIDAQTVNFVACAFRIVSATRGMAGTALPAAAAGAAGGLPTDSTGKTSFNDLSQANVRTAVGLASANLDTQLTAIDDYIDTEIAAIKAVTDNLPNGGALTSITTALTTIDDFLDTEIAAIKTVTDAIGATGTGLTAIPWNAAWDAEVQSEVQDAIEVNHLDHLLAVDYDPASKPGTATALLNELIESDAGVSRYTANALEQGPSGGGGVADWTADERTAIRAILGIPGSGTTPADPTTGILDTIRDLAVGIDGYVVGIDGDTTAILGELPLNFGDMVIGAGTGYVVASSVTGAVGSVTGSVGSVVGNVGGNVTGSVGSVLGGINTTAGVITTLDALDTAQDTEHNATQATLAALNNLSAAQVNAEVVDALATDTYAEPGQGAPAATASLAAKINYLYKAWRNKKTQTATTLSVFADDGTTVDQKSTVSDDGTTATVGEIASGP